jgi:hypothetical protein
MFAVFLSDPSNGRRQWREIMERQMSFTHRFLVGIAISVTTLVGAHDVVNAQTSFQEDGTYKGCKVGTLETLRQEISNESGTVTLGEDYVTLRCDGWNWVPARY